MRLLSVEARGVDLQFNALKTKWLKPGASVAIPLCGELPKQSGRVFDLVIDYKQLGSVTPLGERTLHFTLQNGEKVPYDESTPFVPLCAKGGLDNVIHTPTNTVLEKTGTKDWFVIWYQVLQSLKIFLQAMLRIG